ncbi:DUF2332 domain-containing protein [Polymorphobacter fuscus]|uniref:DUF2332 family protein n=1 Tax=Sandarakinorhabdus fusca TaxID=1439888 RepID=A0A7C9GRE6_9SPHN|nr:DUF2332 domain-containing protein [Polymorphobacter fuscus]KAB7644416.1 DUF2332 domain-containing protein [Polymorphobacter fuscus]MQT18336.1 DUF2332 family protein [Polymorphobacter fuscus]NJC08235.1 hypothetical protein [Polymorphobacter fuscus]
MTALPPGVAKAFAGQAHWCRSNGAPLTAAVCEAALDACDARSATGRALIAWPGEPRADALALRFAGGCNGLVRAGLAPGLAALYPPMPVPPVPVLAAALRDVLAKSARDAELCRWLEGPPQTNEVARSGVLMPGLMAIAAATGLPLRVFELGCSAGLNLNLDKFGYDLAGVRVGDAASAVQLAPAWTGPPPPVAEVRIAARRGVDLNPLDVADAGVRDRLLAYVWPDQPDRLARARAAIALAQAQPPPIDRGDAAGWTEQHVAPVTGSVAVVYHSIAFQYFPPVTKARIAAHLAGLPAHAEAPVAWLRFEMDDAAAAHLPTLRLTLWRGGAAQDHLLARAHPHGASVAWH